MRNAKIISIDIKDEYLEFVKKNNYIVYYFHTNKCNIILKNIISYLDYSFLLSYSIMKSL